ncbi:hypothetical protein VFC49_08910 [Thermococcus sp. SY098]|uniref:hypothetical protein n=1 Tax=Thermococcus sp. SY098 TaxID=3111325 RepID=UPI002D7A2B02|nr:hypothetical protein [Thermococcus sp. SY098]WRS52169.1 hypothetical protein VFC49_08910 [Thermococcus sp. SY098]
MKRAVILMTVSILLLSSFGLALERHLPYEDAEKNDEGIYIYFKSILLQSESVLDNIIDEVNSSVEYSLKLEARLNITKEEVEFYKSMGVKSKIEEYLPPFLELGKGIKEIAAGQSLFLENLKVVEKNRDYYSYLKAVKGLEMIKNGIFKVKNATVKIERLEFITKEGEPEKLNVEPLKNRINRIGRMYKTYYALLKKYEVVPPDEIVLYASDLNPFIYENVTFYGYARGFDNIILHIGNKTVAVPVEKDYFSVGYSFKKSGTYEVFAQGMRGANVKTSNVLILNVSKIPTKIILPSKQSAYIGQKIELKGVLLDYYGEPLGNQRLEIVADDKIFSVKTLSNGSFSFEVGGKKWGEYRVVVNYKGSGVYKESSAISVLYFMRYPVNIKITAEKDKVAKGKEVYVFGEVVGAKKPILISVYVDGRPYQEWLTNTVFGFKIRFNETGFHEIYAYFGGNDIYSPAKSNVLRIEVVPYTALEVFAVGMLLLLFILMYVYIPRRRKAKGGISDKEFVEMIKTLEALEKEKKKEVKGLREIYREVYTRLISQYNLKPSLTPRELLKMLRSESFSYSLERLTNLHEKYVYGRKKLRIQEVVEYIKSAGRVLISFVVREEI